MTTEAGDKPEEAFKNIIDHTDEELLEAMHRAGCREIHFGLETADEALRLAAALVPHVAGFKVGLELLMGPGPSCSRLSLSRRTTMPVPTTTSPRRRRPSEQPSV